MKTIFIGSDHSGVEIKAKIKNLLAGLHLPYEDKGTNSAASVDYPDFAKLVSFEVAKGKGVGILICGTGIGMSIAANKIPGIRAALCYNEESAVLAREHNNANICVVGARTMSWNTIESIIKAFLTTPYSEGERHTKRINKLENTP